VDGLNRRHLLQPADEQFDIGPADRERVQLVVGAPAQVQLQIGAGVSTGPALVSGQMSGDRYPQQIVRNTTRHNGIGHTTNRAAELSDTIAADVRT
jgi:class 3 adenylate cyclase